MIVAVDVQYDEAADTAQGGAVVFDDWASATPEATYTTTLQGLAPYQPGQFYLRELPVLMKLVAPILVKHPIKVVVVDGHTWLGQGNPGLGAHLYGALLGRVAVVGVAKRAFHTSHEVAEEVVRGASARPLWVTSQGLPVADAAKGVAAMAGPNRHPLLLKWADHLARGLPP